MRSAVVSVRPIKRHGVFLIFSLILILVTTTISCKKEKEKVVESEWSIYNSSNSSLFANYGIGSIICDKSGVLWFSTYGLSSFNGTNWSRYDISNSGVLISGVSDGVKANNGVNWFGSLAGLLKFQNSNWSLYNMNNSNLPSSGVSGVTIDNQNNIWLATDQGIVKYDGNNNWVIYNSDNTPITCKFAKHIRAKSNGEIWVGIILNQQVCPDAETGCLARYLNGNWTIFTSLNSNLPSGEISALEIDKSDNLWISIDGKIIKFNGNSFDIFDESNSILTYNNNSITDIAFDNQNNLWASSGLNGVYKYDGTNWKNFTKQNSELPENFITSIAIDNNNAKWFGCLTAKVCKYTGN